MLCVCVHVCVFAETASGLDDSDGEYEEIEAKGEEGGGVATNTMFPSSSLQSLSSEEDFGTVHYTVVTYVALPPSLPPPPPSLYTSPLPQVWVWVHLQSLLIQ